MMEAFTSSSQSFGALILMKSTLLLSLIFLISLAFRKASASTQHYLWTLAYVALVTLPVVSYVAVANTSWRIPVPVFHSSVAVPAPPLETAASSPVSSALRQTPVTTHDASLPSRSFVWPSTWHLVWFMGGVVFMIRLVAGVAASRRSKRAAQELKDEAWLDLLGDAQARIGALEDVDLRTTSTSQLPMTIGVWHPTILLPNASSEYSAQRRWAVLLHELAHIRRRDCLTQLVCQMACAVFWWHPLAWIGARHMRALSERASDDLVLDAGAKPSEYAHDLLDMARGLNLHGASAPIASVTMAHRSRLEARLLAILDPAMARRAMSSRFKLPAALFGLGILVSVALAVPTVAVSALAQSAQLAQEPEPQGQERDGDRDDDDDEEREELSEAQEKARLALAEALNDPDGSVRDEALGVLVRLGDERTVPHLVEALASGNAEARAEAAWGLGRMRHQEAADDLIDALSDENDDVREQSAWSLGMIRSDRAVNALGVVLTSDSSSNAREQAAWALGMIKSNDAVDALVAAMVDENDNVRSQAAWALGMIRDPRGLAGLSKAVRDDDVDVREQAIWALGMLRSRDSLDVLVVTLGDASAEIRGQAAWALGMLGDGRAVDALSEALRDPDAEVREQAAWALGRTAKTGTEDVDIDMELDLDIPDMEVEIDDPNPNPNLGANPQGAVL